MRGVPRRLLALVAGRRPTVRSRTDSTPGTRSEPDDGGLLGRGLVLAGVVLVAVGSLLEWHVVAAEAVAGGISVESSVSGLDADGEITLGVGVLGGGLALVLWDRGGGAVAVLTGLVAGGLAGYHLLLPARALGLPDVDLIDLSALIDPGIGLYAVLLGAGLVLVGGIAGLARS